MLSLFSLEHNFGIYFMLKSAQLFFQKKMENKIFQFQQKNSVPILIVITLPL